jgi:hypothetical protein
MSPVEAGHFFSYIIRDGRHGCNAGYNDPGLYFPKSKKREGKERNPEIACRVNCRCPQGLEEGGEEDAYNARIHTFQRRLDISVTTEDAPEWQYGCHGEQTGGKQSGQREQAIQEGIGGGTH